MNTLTSSIVCCCIFLKERWAIMKPIFYMMLQWTWAQEEGDRQRRVMRMEYHSPGKGQIREASGWTLGHLARRRSKLAGHGLEKKWESPRGRQFWPSRERRMKPEQESCDPFWEQISPCLARIPLSPPTPCGYTHTHTHCVALILLQVKGFGESSHQLGSLSFLPPSGNQWKGETGIDGWMLKSFSAWTLNITPSHIYVSSILTFLGPTAIIL